MSRILFSAALSGLLLGALALLPGSVRAQWAFPPPAIVPAGHGFVRVMPYGRNCPLVIAGIEIGSRQVVTGKPFVADADWIQHLRITFKNVSKVPVTVINVNVGFPETGTGAMGSSILVNPLYAGQVPAVYRTLRDGRVRPNMGFGTLNLLPGESYTMDAGLHISDRFLKVFAGLVKRAALPNQCQLSIAFVVMGDGVSWNAGYYRKPDPSASYGFAPVSASAYMEN